MCERQLSLGVVEPDYWVDCRCGEGAVALVAAAVNERVGRLSW